MHGKRHSKGTNIIGYEPHFTAKINPLSLESWMELKKLREKNINH